jgi:hypothetical protein
MPTTPSELVTMSAKEIDRLTVIQRVRDRRLSQKRAAGLVGLSTRQMRRLVKAYGRDGTRALVSKRRGRRANNATPPELRTRVMALVAERYTDFGPTLAAEKLVELHDLRVSRETLRKWMIGARLWTSRRDRAAQAHQPRPRRDCLGDLVQIDGCDHDWFEGRGERCSLLVYVDDATSRLMELRFVRTESAFDYFDATKSYLRKHGRPAAFYSDKHSIFRVAREGSRGPYKGVTQFGRALAELSIEIICANTPQAKGRVERMNKTLQDRLVKELRLQGISTMEAGNSFLPTFAAKFNARFARPPRNPHDAHRPLRPQDDLELTFTWREARTMSRDLVVHYKRSTYLVRPTEETRGYTVAKRQVEILEDAAGVVDIRYEGRSLPYSVYNQQPVIAQGEIVENKRLGAALGMIRAIQDERDSARLASKKVSLRGKDRIRKARLAAGRRGAPDPRELLPGMAISGPVAEYLNRFAEEQRLKRKRANDLINERKRQRQIEAALTSDARR